MQNDVMTIVTPAGEMVGRIKDENDNTVTLESPRAFIQTQEGMGFAPGVCMTGEQNPKEMTFNKSQVILMCKSSDQVSKAWIQQTSGLVLST